MTASDWLTAPMPLPRPGPLGWLRIVLRGGALALVVFGGLAILLLLRLAEHPLCGLRRPVTPFLTQAVCRVACALLGLRLSVRGVPLVGPGALVANHASWLDIFVLNAVTRVMFVSKAEVAGWAGIGWLARATGTVFITRNGAEAPVQRDLLETRLKAGHRLLFFPEGTSTDSRRILPFKSTLFAALLAPSLRGHLQVQPITVIYTAPTGMDPRFYGWWGDMDFAPHLIAVLSRPGGSAEVVLHPSLVLSDMADRKALAAVCEAKVRAAHPLGGAVNPAGPAGPAGSPAPGPDRDQPRSRGPAPKSR